MKQLKISLVAVIFFMTGIMCGSVKADNVDLQTAKQIGAYYFTVATGAKAPVNADQLDLAQQIDNPTLCIPALYAFNVKGNGFVVVSASDCTDPILAYSPDGNLDNPNPACRYFLESYAKLISDNQNSHVQTTPAIKSKWEQLYEHTFTCDLDTKGVLVKAKWDQGDPDYPSYNVLCPQINGKPCYVGCVATAMSMIMHYWKYPVKGGSDNGSTASCSWNNTTIKYKFAVDSNKFVYEDMPNQISYQSPWENKRAISKLGFACGVTVKMGWSLDGSGAQSKDVPTAFSKWFKYSPDALYKQRQGITDANWVAILHDEIDNHARPVYYSAYDPSGTGRDAAGHAFLITGSSNNDQNKFYINWGWNGSANGFFTIAPASAIGNAAGYNFSHGHAIVYRIYPLELGIEDNTQFSSTVAYPNPASDYIMIPVNLNVNAILAVYSIDGKMVDNIVVPAGTQEYRLDLQQYKPGTYVYRVNGSAVKFTVL
ncbi:MAG: thiol protease/hemagglutinin PrtT [Bacteroidales bacterium]|nr:thiol protease/hemagglutinin PrtT [Bacteroidales bacterium]